MADKHTNILEGEASESDEEITDYPSFVKNTMVAEPSPPSTPAIDTSSSIPGSTGVVVSGEASESDDEMMEVVGTRNFPSLQGQGLGDFELTMDTGKELETKTIERPVLSKYQSPFHKKLREQNFSLRCGIVEVTLDNYERVHARLKNSVPYLTRAQGDVQETLKIFKQISDDIDMITNRIKVISETASLPIIQFPEES